MNFNLNDVAKKYGTNKPTINARIKKLERDNPSKVLTFKSDNVIYLTDIGLELLDKNINEKPISRKSFKSKKPLKKDVENSFKKGAEPVFKDELIELLKNNNKLLESQLDAKDREIARLSQIIEAQNQTIKEINQTLSHTLTESHTLIGREQERALIDNQAPELNPVRPKPDRRKSFLSKLLVAGKVIKGDYD